MKNVNKMNSDAEHCMLSFSIPIKVEPQDILVLVQEKKFKILNENNDNKKAETNKQKVPEEVMSQTN